MILFFFLNLYPFLFLIHITLLYACIVKVDSASVVFIFILILLLIIESVYLNIFRNF